MNGDQTVRTPTKRTLQVTGAILFLVGAAAVIVPAVASVTIALLVGWLFAFAGVMALVSAAMHHADHRVLRALWGLVSVAIGAYLVLAPLEGTITLTFVLVVNFLLMGAIRIGGWWAARGTPGAAAMGINGTLGIVLAGLILVDFPSSAEWAIGLLVGIDLMFFGIALFSNGRTIDHTAPVGTQAA